MNPTTVWQQLFYTTVLIETDTGCGTGFIVNPKGCPILITNKHIVRDAKKGIVRFHLREGDDLLDGQGYKLSIPDFEQYWIGHRNPDVDVTAMSMSLILEQAHRVGRDLFYKAIPQEMFPAEDDLERLVGYPRGIYDQKNYLPVVRQGITASPLQIDYEGRPEFLVDASVFPGSSGSPVFTFNKGQSIRMDQDRTVVTTGYILGIISAVHQQQIPDIEDPAKSSTHLMNLGVVFKARTIIEAAKPFMDIGQRKKLIDHKGA